jgi:hypothetical protein
MQPMTASQAEELYKLAPLAQAPNRRVHGLATARRCEPTEKRDGDIAR